MARSLVLTGLATAISERRNGRIETAANLANAWLYASTHTVEITAAIQRQKAA